MRALRVGALVVVGLGWGASRVEGQGADSLVTRVAGGFAVALPASWEPLNDSLLAYVRNAMDTALTNSRDSVVRASIAGGRPVLLLHERLPGALDPSANVNAAPAPGVTPTTFLEGGSALLAEIGPQLCRVLTSSIEQAGQRLLECGATQLDRGADRAIAVTRMVRTGAQGFVTVWLAQYPDRNVIYSLTLSAPQREEARYRPLFERIWRGVTIEGTP